MLAKTWSAAIQGVDASTVEIEVNAPGGSQETIVNVVGLPDTAVRESRERVWSALYAIGCYPPHGRTTINLAPADMRKEGAGFDFPIALGVIATTGRIDRGMLEGVMVAGELALDGTVRPMRGILPIAMHARGAGFKSLLVPAANAREAGIVRGLNVFGIDHLHQAVDLLSGNPVVTPVTVDINELYSQMADRGNDFADVKGQEVAKRALEVAAAGSHNVLMVGPPGTGKTMLAKRLTSILPPLTLDEAMDVTRIHSVAGTLDTGRSLIVQRPFRAPHHTVSDAGLIGGQSIPRPGEISLAHHGVLFLDELPEFRRNVLEVLRQPLENGEVTVSRAIGSFTFPANVMLVAAMNPCPCGHYGSTQRQCRCSSGQIHHYRGKISGPLLDRIDIHVEVAPIGENELLNRRSGEGSAAIRERVRRARDMQQRRFAGTAPGTNASMSGRAMEKHCALADTTRAILRLAIVDLNLSARAYDRVLRVARTCADLDGADTIAPEHVTEAIQYRSLDRQLW